MNDSGAVEYFQVVPRISWSKIAPNGQGLAVWRYSVLRKPGLMLGKDMKMKIYSTAGLYSLAGYVAE